MRSDANPTTENVRARLGLYIHAIVYVLVIALLFAIDSLTPGGWWFYWPALGWGIGLAAHAAGVIGAYPQIE